MADQTQIRVPIQGIRAFIDDLIGVRRAIILAGILIGIIAVLAVAFPVVTLLAAEVVCGWLLLFAGLMLFFGACSQQSKGAICGGLFLSVLILVVGALLVFDPVAFVAKW